MKLRHAALLAGAGAAAERYLFREVRDAAWHRARIRAYNTAHWYAMGGDRRLARRLADRLSRKLED